MKTLVCFTLAVSALASPALSFAQTASAPPTRSQVYADLVRLEQAGYRPSAGDDPSYPADIQEAERKLQLKDQAERTAPAAVNQTPQSRPAP